MRRVYLGGGIAAVVAVVIAAIVASGEPSPVECDATVQTRNALVSALASPDSAGKAICVTADITGDQIEVSTDFAETARFVAQPENMTVSIVPLLINGATNLTVEGFDVPAGGFFIANGAPSDNLTISRNWFHDYVGNGIAAFGGARHDNLKVTGNRISCVSYPADGDPSGPTGYGFYSDAETPNLDFSYNTIQGCGNSADGAQLGNVTGGRIANNVVKDIEWNGVGEDPHTDCLMVWASSADVDIENNRVYDCTDLLVSPDGDDIRVTNNLLVNLDGGNSCLDAHPNGSSGDVYPLRHTYTRNTIVNCDNAGLLMGGGAGDRNGNVLDRNIIQDMHCPAPSALETVDHNLFLASNPCDLPGTNTFGFSPTWVSTSDPDRANYYIPSNLPAGYENAGYRYVPAGHTSMPNEES